MASDLQCNLIGRDFCVEFLGIALRLGIEVGEVEPGAPRGAGEMVAEVPVARAAPDNLGHLVAEGEAHAAARGGLAAQIGRGTSTERSVQYGSSSVVSDSNKKKHRTNKK